MIFERVFGKALTPCLEQLGGNSEQLSIQAAPHSNPISRKHCKEHSEVSAGICTMLSDKKLQHLLGLPAFNFEYPRVEIDTLPRMGNT